MGKKALLDRMNRENSGIQINLVSVNRLGEMTSEEKIRFILDEVEQGKVLVLERGLTPPEEARLIEATMREIDQDTFIGIEMQSYGQEEYKNFLQKLVMGGMPRPRMAVIGPATLLRTIHKDSKEIQTRVVGPGVEAPAEAT